MCERGEIRLISSWIWKRGFLDMTMQLKLGTAFQLALVGPPPRALLMHYTFSFSVCCYSCAVKRAWNLAKYLCVPTPLCDVVIAVVSFFAFCFFRFVPLALQTMRKEINWQIRHCHLQQKWQRLRLPLHMWLYVCMYVCMGVRCNKPQFREAFLVWKCWRWQLRFVALHTPVIYCWQFMPP